MSSLNQARRQLALQFHPDKNMYQNEYADGCMKIINGLHDEQKQRFE